GRPGAERVGPRLDPEGVRAGLEERELAFPCVVSERPQGPFLRFALARRELAEAQRDGQFVVAFLEHVRGHPDGFSRGPLHRVATAVDLRLDVLDYDAARPSGHWLGSSL